MTGTGAGARPGPALVLGVGNRDRGDDAVGPIVADVMAGRWPGALEVVVVEGDLSTLALRWRPEHRVVVVDAMVSGAEPGTAVAVEWPPAATAGPAGVGASPTSTHSIGLAAALELARLLGRLPAALTVVGVEGAGFDLLAPLSPAVAAAVEPVVAQVATLLGLGLGLGLGPASGPPLAAAPEPHRHCSGATIWSQE